MDRQPTLYDGIFSFPNWNCGNSSSIDAWDLFSGMDIDTLNRSKATMDHKSDRDVNEGSTDSAYNSDEKTPEASLSHNAALLEKTWEDDDLVDDVTEDSDFSMSPSAADSSRSQRRNAGKRSWDAMTNEQAVSPRRVVGKRNSIVRTAQSRGKVTLLWRKYGQKILRGKPLRGIVRCYYKCYHSTCPAKKLVEKHSSNMDKVIDIKYESTHNHPIAEQDLEDSGLQSQGTPVHSESSNDASDTDHEIVSSRRYSQ